MGADASVAANAALRVAAEVLVVLDRLFVEARVIWVGGFDLDDRFLLLDLILVLGLGVLRGFFGGPLSGDVGHGDHLLIQQFGCFLADGIVDVENPRMSGRQTSGINRLPLSVLFAKIGDILDQDLLGRWIGSTVVLLDLLEERTQVVPDLASLGLNQPFLKELRRHDFDF